MKIKIIQVTKKGEVADLSSLLPKDFKVPDGFVLQGLERKLVMVSNEDEVIIAIGPEVNNNNHDHLAISRIITKQFPNAKDLGYGSILFSFGNGWSAKLYSEHVGELDPCILTKQAREEIRKILGMHLSLSWSKLV